MAIRKKRNTKRTTTTFFRKLCARPDHLCPHCLTVGCSVNDDNMSSLSWHSQ